MIILCEERYAEAKAHAAKTGDKSLQECIDKLQKWESSREGSTMKLTKDFAPLSFMFWWYDSDMKEIMRGGLLYHGNPDESRAVTLDPQVGWQTHT